MATIEIYDTTLRDGTQQEGISLTVGDKLGIARLLDDLGVAYIEGGWPGANPKDNEFFARAKDELDLETAVLVAFGSTRRAGGSAENDDQLAALIEADTDVVCLVGKSWDYHVEHALRTEPEEAIAMIADSVAHIRASGKRAFFDAEHFFDGYLANPGFALETLRAAHESGAERLVLCDTNGGMLPQDAERIVREVSDALPGAALGCHFHNDAGTAVASSLSAVAAGAVQVQGCLNGYGERTGNADLCSVIPNLSLKLGHETIPADRLPHLTRVSHHVAEIVNLTLDDHLPYVGTSAFTHKAGLHTSALARRPDAYEHLPPASVGNTTRTVVSELAGRSTVLAKVQENGLDLSPDEAQAVVDRIKTLEHEGYHFEAADGSFELLVREAQGWKQPFFELESYRVFVEHRDGDVTAEATVKVHVNGERVVTTREGDGPVSAIDSALRAALCDAYPELGTVHLTDYRVRDLDSSDGTNARVRVLCRHTDAEGSWGTIGVHKNIIDASWKAVCEGLVVGLLRTSTE
ncbi:MAG: citramalate synthase [Actinomycetota bacterium]